MGYYIPSCQKMRYKGDYKPSDLLCPEHFQWVPLDEAVRKLAGQKYSRFIDAPPPVLSDAQQRAAINKVPFLHRQTEIFHLQDLTATSIKQLTPRLLEYLSRVGPQLAEQMLFAT
eukprot:TRINITY_DN11412_c0_g1_i1.p1 TRINITY_DN11412_c0_g1~~TRINITY_DN11412_c0_g1_i1.p1  ORF type:complete len:134 (-),score=42.62 TRINITY_DN11412_c0_g1_i1:334-678(-)